MSFIKKLVKRLDNTFDGNVTAHADNNCLVLTGELPRWSDVVFAGRLAVRDNPYIGLVNDIVCTGETAAPIRKPTIEDGALEWEEPDVLIIGGGIIGCAIARELSRYKLDVLLVEKEHDVAMQTSGRNDGMIHSGIDLKKGTQKYKFNKLGNPMFEMLCAELGVEFRRSGQYLCFARRIWEPFMFLSLLYWKWLGLKGVKVVKRDQLNVLEPSINPNISSALFFPATGVLCPFSLTVAYAENAVQNGVTISFDTIVTEMETENGRIVSVKTNRGTIRPKVVVNAAGVFCDDIAAMAGDRFYSIHPRKGTTAILDKKYANDLVMTAVSSLATSSTRKRHTKGGGVVRTIHGNTLVGPDAVETIHKEDYTTTAYNISGIFSSHARTIPALSEKQVITYFSGIRAATYEEDFIICKGKYIANIVHAAGIQSPGLTAAPAIGFEVAHMVVELFGGENYVHLNPDFDPIRIAPPHPATMDVAALDELIKTNPDYGIIICRCENITKGEILNALRRNVRCDTLDSVKRRVRPGMGRCQGGFCSPLILDIISSEKRTTPHNISKGGSGSELLFGSTKTTFEKKTTTSDKAPVRKSSADSKAERILRARADSMRGVIKTIREDDDDYDV